MPRSIRRVGLFCVTVLGSLTPLVGPERVAWAQAAPAAASGQSSPTPAPTAKSVAAPTPSASGTVAVPAVAPVTSPANPTTPPPVATASTTPASPAPSPEAQAAASAALAAGQAAYASGDYVSAESQFRASLAQVPTAAAQYGLAMTLDLEAKPAEASEAFTKLFAMSDFATLPPEQASAAQQRHAVLQTIPASVVVTVNTPGAALEVDGVVQEGQPPFSLRLPAGKHTLRVNAPEYEPQETNLDVKPAEQREVNLELVALPKPAPAAPKEVVLEAAPPAPPPSKMPAYVTIGVAGAAAITGAVFGIQALSAKSTFDKSPTVANADDVERNALIADMAFGIAFTLGITGVVLLTTDEPSDPAAERPQTALELMPYVSPSSGGAAARLTF